jgi:hypothetical protein
MELIHAYKEKIKEQNFLITPIELSRNLEAENMIQEAVDRIYRQAAIELNQELHRSIVGDRDGDYR